MDYLLGGLGVLLAPQQESLVVMRGSPRCSACTQRWEDVNRHPSTTYRCESTLLGVGRPVTICNACSVSDFKLFKN